MSTGLIGNLNQIDQFEIKTFITARKRSCGKVMFSEVFVCPRGCRKGRKGGCLKGGGVPWRGCHEGVGCCEGGFRKRGFHEGGTVRGTMKEPPLLVNKFYFEKLTRWRWSFLGFQLDCFYCAIIRCIMAAEIKRHCYCHCHIYKGEPISWLFIKTTAALTWGRISCIITNLLSLICCFWSQELQHFRLYFQCCSGLPV